MNNYILISQLIINWFHKYGRKTLPWQIRKTPYKIWISEIMLQQTQVKKVIPYFKKFIKTYPTIKLLSKASLDDIMFLWSGLGYYARAKNIYLATKIIKEKFKYKIPDNYLDIISLPGIGKSTAGAILSFSFNFFFSILDSNVKRIIKRCFNIQEHSNKIEKKLWEKINLITPVHNTAQFNQGIMDLGAIICTPKLPSCNICPINILCITNKDKIFDKNQTNIKKKKNKKNILVLLLEYKKQIYLQKRISQKIWNNLFSLLEFKNKKILLNWLYKKNINSKSIIYLKKYKTLYTNFKVNIQPVLINLNYIEKNIFLEDKEHIWYNYKLNKNIGLPTPIKKIIYLTFECL